MNLDLLDLARHLKQERLYVSSEKNLLQKLHEEVTQLADKLYRVSWISRHQRQTLNSLISANADSPPAACCQRANALEEVAFIDGYKALGFQDTVYGEFLCCLKDNPKVVAMCLAQGEREYSSGIQCLVHIIMSSVYGNAVIQEDERRVLQLLQALMELELASNDDPRRLLRRGSCAFSHAMRLFTEGLFSGKLYLTAALHEPVMALLMENEMYFETDTRKMLDHLSLEEQIKLFGQKNSPTYTAKLQEYIDRVSNQVVILCNKFISSLKNSMFCFPQSLDWLISQFYKILIRSGKVDQMEVRAMCGDLLLTCFICPAIVNPEPYGVASDILISEVARFNLMQVAQILQSLSLMREDTPMKSGDILSRFAKGCMSSYLDTVIDSHSNNANPAINNNQLQGMTRSVALICESELHNLVSYFRSSVAANEGNPDLKDLEVALSVLPNPSNLTPSSNSTGQQPPAVTPPGTPGSISRKGSKALKVAKKIGSKSTLPSAVQEEQDSDASPPSDSYMVTQPEDVLVISLANHANECPGMMSESKVLQSFPKKSKSRSEEKRANLVSITEHPEKQLRFSAEASSVTNDHLLEAMSIGASNSVYSIDYDNENTSNLSGRNTPRSAISLASSTMDNPRPDLIDSTQLPNNANITDRFGKFEIGDELENKKMRGLTGETFSDTWSTDVIGSDNSEPSEANPTERLQEISESELEYSALGAVARLPESITEISETTSETWSVDVLQSDSEALDDRLIEVADAPEVTGLQLLEEESEQMSSKASEGQSSRRSSYGSQSIGRSSNNDSPSEDNPKKDQAQEYPDNQPGPTDPSRKDGGAQLSVDQQQPLDDFGMSSFSSRVNDPDKRPSTVVVDHFYQLGGGDNKLSLPPKQAANSESKLDSLLVDFDPLATSEPTAYNQATATSKHSNTLPLGARPKQKFIITSHFYNESGQRGPIGVTNPLYELSNGDFHSSGAIKSNVSNPFNRHSHPFSQKANEPVHGESDIFFLTDKPKRRTNPFDTSNEEKGQGASLENDFTPTQENCEGSFEDAFIKGDKKDVSKSKERTEDSVQDHSLEERDIFPSGDKELPSTNSYSSTRVDSGFASGESLDLTHLRGNSFTSSGSLSSASGMLTSSESGRFTSSGTYNKPILNTSNFGRSISFEGSAGEKAENGSDKGKPWWKTLIGSRKPKNRSAKEETKDAGAKPKKSSSTEGIPITGINNQGLIDTYNHEDGGIGIMSSSVPDTTSEDILDKYRGLGKAQSHDHLVDVDATDNLLSFGVQDRQSSIMDQDGQSVDSDLETSYAFQDAKRKLRIVLCAADFHTLPWLTNFSHRHRARSIIGSIIQKDISSYPENELIAFLKVQLAEAINLQNKSLIAQLHETLRCVSSFDDDTSKRLVSSLTEDYENRSPYICYLVLSRKGLIASKSHLERLLERVERDKFVSNKYFTSVCVRLFLGRQEDAIQKFIGDFKRLTVSDEKTDLVEHFLSLLKNWIQQDAIWSSASEAQKFDAEVATERAIMGRIYKLALYPNAEGDIHRDQVLYEHIQRLSKVVTASHRALQIPEKYRRESPWPAAQAEILNINVYKTPKDKLQCVLRCCSIVMNLLNMASDNSVPGADDFVPVMVFVLIKANPPSLLSTVQYVNSFYDNRLSGEEMYWWMQFSAAIEFIKTIDDRK